MGVISTLVALPAGDCGRVAAGPALVSRQAGGRDAAVAAAGAAAGGHRLPAAAALRANSGWAGRSIALGIEVVFTWKAVVLAMAVMSFPLMVLTIRAGFEQVDRRYERGGGHARRRAVARVRHHHAAARHAQQRRRPRFSALPARSASSAPRSSSPAAFPARRRRWRWRSSTSPKRAVTPMRRGCCWCRSRWRSAPCCLANPRPAPEAGR